MPEASSPDEAPLTSDVAESAVASELADATESAVVSETVVDWTPDAAALEQYATLARAALLDMTDADTIGELAGHKVETDRVVSIYFAAAMTGYPGWRWTVSISHLDDAEPTVLETELTPGEGALLAPEWTPWVDRLAAQNAADELAAAGLDEESDDDDDDDESDDDDDESDDDDDDESDDDEDDDESDDDDEVTRVRSLLHAGDLDGVDIDDLDDDESDDDESDPEPDDEVTEDSASTPRDVDESGEAESDPDGAGDEHPGAVGGDDRPREDQ